MIGVFKIEKTGMPHGIAGFLLINLYNNTRNKTAGTHLQVVLIHHHAVCPLLQPLCLLHVTGGDKVALPCRFLANTSFLTPRKSVDKW